MARAGDASPRLLAVVPSLAAAGIHFAVSPAHFEEYSLFGWFFVAAASLQALWSVQMAIAVSRPLTVAGAIGNAALIATWAWTRFVGVPVGPAAGSTEPVAAVDAAAVSFEAMVVVLSVLLLSQRHWAIWRAVRLGVVPIASIVMFVVVGIAVAADAGEHAAESGHSQGHSHSETP